MAEDNDDKTILFDDGVLSKQPAGPTDARPPRAQLICLDTSQIDGAQGPVVIPLTEGQQTIGRGDDCTFPIACRRLSRQHARIVAGDGVWGVEDLDSTNGIQVDGKRLKAAWLTHGQEVRFGPIPFRYEVERPGTVLEPAHAADGDDGEHTMIIGSAGASRAVLDAVRKAEPVAEPAISKPTAPERLPVGAAPKKGSPLVPVLAGGLLLAAVAGGGYFYWPEWVRQNAIADIAEASGKISKDLSAANREAAVVSARIPEAEAERRRTEIEAKRIALKDISRNARAILAENPKNWPLSSVIANAEFLIFEKDFFDALRQGQFDQAAHLVSALDASIQGLSAAIPANVEDKDRKDMRNYTDLVRLARLVADYRRFAVSYPQVSRDGGPQPTPALIADLEPKKAEFARYLHGLNVQLQRDYLLFYGLVELVEKQDLLLFSHWKETIGKSQ